MSDFLFEISEKIISDDKLETLYKTKNNLINTIIENFLGNNGESIAEDFKQFNENFETLYNKLGIEQEDNNSVLEAYSLGSLKSIVDVALAYFNIFDIQQKLMREKWIYECIKNINTCISISEENLKKVLSRNLNTNSEIKLYQCIDYLKENKILIKEKTTNSSRYSLSITARKAFQLYLETLSNNDENINDYVNLNKFYLNLLDNLADNIANNKRYAPKFIIAKSQSKISNNFNFNEPYVLAHKIAKINYSIKKQTQTNLQTHLKAYLQTHFKDHFFSTYYEKDIIEEKPCSIKKDLYNYITKKETFHYGDIIEEKSCSIKKDLYNYITEKRKSLY